MIHIAAGMLAVGGASIAIFVKMMEKNHRWHIFAGRLFFYSMLVVFLTVLPLTYINPNPFLFLIGIFSFYMTFTGWRYAVNRKGIADRVDFFAMFVMALTAFAMLVYGLSLFLNSNGYGVVIFVFGVLGGWLAYTNYKSYKAGPVKGKDRISSHLNSMMGATIAVLTAVLVVNVQTDPVWIAWLLPTVVITPIMMWMDRKLYEIKTSK